MTELLDREQTAQVFTANVELRRSPLPCSSGELGDYSCRQVAFHTSSVCPEICRDPTP